MSLPPLFGNNFPNFKVENFGNNVRIRWYEAQFAQSKYPPGQTVSEACTLICLLVAQRIGQSSLRMEDLEILIAEAIIEGNAVHSWILRNRIVLHPYLNAEEALKFGGKKLNHLKEWTFEVIPGNIETTLAKNIKKYLREWYRNPLAKNLFVLLITCGRTILLVFHLSNRVFLFDSHAHQSERHLDRGLLVAQSTVDAIEELCAWYIEEVLYDCYHNEPSQYELACFYDQRRK